MPTLDERIDKILKGYPMGIADRPGSEPTADLHARIHRELDMLGVELIKSMTKHAPMHSPHEGMSVIKEEVDELWDHVKADTGRTTAGRKEARQVAAMGLRYVLDLCQDVEAADAKAAEEQKRKMEELQRSFDAALAPTDGTA